MSLIQLNTEQGALTQTYLATAPDLTLEDAKAFYVPLAQAYHTMHPQASLLLVLYTTKLTLGRPKIKYPSTQLGSIARKRSLDISRLGVHS